MDNRLIHCCRVNEDVIDKGLLTIGCMMLLFLWVSAARPELLEGIPIFTEICRGLLLLGYFSFFYALIIHEGKWYDRFAYVGIAVQVLLVISFWYLAWGFIA